MVERKREHINRRWLWAFLIALLLHFTLFLLMNDNIAGFFKPLPDNNTDVREIVFDLTPAQQTPREVIQTFSESAKPPEQADFLSDKHAVAANDATDALRGSMPRFDGQTEYARNFETSRPLAQADQPFSDSHAGGEDAPADGFRVTEKPVSLSKSSFTREKLLGRSGANASDNPEPTYNNQSSVTEQGGISFNTYAWEFAPYMLKLKDRLQRNIYPPSSFTRLGFGGNNLLTFRILPDGTLQGPAVLRTEGDKALVETSCKAVSLSAPFWPLPEEFPEKFLEVTVYFRYLGLTPTP